VSFTLGGINLEVKPVSFGFCSKCIQTLTPAWWLTKLITMKGQLVGIVGEVGAGKSSLLLSLLGELKCTSGILSMQNAEVGMTSINEIESSGVSILEFHLGFRIWRCVSRSLDSAW